MGNSFFHFKQFSIYKQSKGLKVGTDACVLGGLACLPEAKSILDIGTGSGVLALMMAQKHPEANIVAIEKHQDIAEQAAYNFEHSPFRDRISMVQTNVLDFKADFAFDLIVSNPPYFNQHLKGSEALKNSAMHIEDLSSEALLKTCRQIMHHNSQLWLIYPCEQAMECQNKWLAEGGYVKAIYHINHKKDQSIRQVVCLTLHPCQCVEDTLVLKTKEGHLTESFRQLMQDFYLENTDVYKAPKQPN